MAQITKAAMDAAIEQGKREASAMYTATISRLKAERDDLRIKLDAEIEAGKRSVANEIDKSKGGGWRTRPIRWAVYGAAALAVLGVAVWLASRAQAREPCAPFADLPPDVTMICHAPSGMWVYDSSVWSRYLPTGVRCARPA